MNETWVENQYILSNTNQGRISKHSVLGICRKREFEPLPKFPHPMWHEGAHCDFPRDVNLIGTQQSTRRESKIPQIILSCNVTDSILPNLHTYPLIRPKFLPGDGSSLARSLPYDECRRLKFIPGQALLPVKNRAGKFTAVSLFKLNNTRDLTARPFATRPLKRRRFPPVVFLLVLLGVHIGKE